MNLKNWLNAANFFCLFAAFNQFFKIHYLLDFDVITSLASVC
jgi:hypothetical protein